MAQDLVDLFLAAGATTIYVGPSLPLDGSTGRRRTARQPRQPPARPDRTLSRGAVRHTAVPMESSATPAGGASTTVATYDNYRDAERAVDYLSDKGFPVERTAIVGTGLKTVEQIAGRLTTGRAAVVGAGQGAMVGLLFALLFGLFFDGPAFFGVVLYGLVAGALFGAIFGAIGQAMQGGRRDFASIRSMQAESYEVQVDHEVSAQAKQLLAEMPAS